MNVRRYWDLQIAADGGKNLTAFAYANSAKRTHGASIRLVVRRLENEMNIFGGADLDELLSHEHSKPLHVKSIVKASHLIGDQRDDEITLRPQPHPHDRHRIWPVSARQH